MKTRAGTERSCIASHRSRMRAVKRKSQKLRVCFLHPDLGIGGAERFASILGEGRRREAFAVLSAVAAMRMSQPMAV